MNTPPHLVIHILHYNSLHFNQIILILQLVHQFIQYFNFNIFKFEIFIDYLFIKDFSHHLFTLFTKYFDFI